MRKAFGLVALLGTLLFSMALGQRAVGFRLVLPPGGAGLGLALEAPLERSLAFRAFGDLWQFDTVNGSIGNGKQFAVTYGASGLTVNTVAASPLPTPAPSKPNWTP